MQAHFWAFIWAQNSWALCKINIAVFQLVKTCLVKVMSFFLLSHILFISRTVRGCCSTLSTPSSRGHATGSKRAWSTGWACLVCNRLLFIHQSEALTRPLTFKGGRQIYFAATSYTVDKWKYKCEHMIYIYTHNNIYIFSVSFNL